MWHTHTLGDHFRHMLWESYEIVTNVSQLSDTRSSAPCINPRRWSTPLMPCESRVRLSGTASAVPRPEVQVISVGCPMSDSRPSRDSTKWNNSGVRRMHGQ